MMTVKEISELTGISIRTLHYYDQIGLFNPTDKSEAGYRLYDDNALKQLQQILFFREFDIPLKEIKSVMENPDLDSNYILQMQRSMLIAKKERIERLINRIDDILKGEDKMDFEVFSKKEIEELFSIMVSRMPDELRETAAREFGGMEQWKEHYIETVSGENVQKCYLKMVEWFGGKENYVSSVKNPSSKEIAESYLKRIDVILNKLFDRRDSGINSFEVKEVVAEYGFVTKQLYQLKDETGMMISLAQSYRNDDVKMSTDEKYGEGASEFFAQAIENFYK